MAYENSFEEPTLAVAAELSEFLNFTVPGTRQLLDSVGRLEYGLFEALPILEHHHQFVLFSPSFFSSERVGRIILLAASIIVNTYSGARGTVIESIQRFGFIGSDISTLIRLLGAGPRLHEEEMKDILPEGRRGYKIVDRFRRISQSAAWPVEASNVASWLIGDEQMQAALEETEGVLS